MIYFFMLIFLLLNLDVHCMNRQRKNDQLRMNTRHKFMLLKERELEFKLRQERRKKLLSNLTSAERKILIACESSDINILKQILFIEKSKVGLDLCNEDVVGILVLAADRKCEEIIELLVNYGFDIHEDLLWCIKNNWQVAFEVLLRHKAVDVNYQFKKEMSATLLIWAVILNRRPMIKLLLDHPEIEINKYDERFCYTALDYSIKRYLYNFDFADARGCEMMLASAGAYARHFVMANPNVQEGNTMYARMLEWAKTGNVKEIAVLQKKNCTLNIRDAYGNTPLHLAVLHAKQIKNLQDVFIKHDKSMIATILGYKPDLIKVKNKNGETAIDLTISKSKLDILEYFITIAKANYDRLQKSEAQLGSCDIS